MLILIPMLHLLVVDGEVGLSADALVAALEPHVRRVGDHGWEEWPGLSTPLPPFQTRSPGFWTDTLPPAPGGTINLLEQ